MATCADVYAQEEHKEQSLAMYSVTVLTFGVPANFDMQRGVDTLFVHIFQVVEGVDIACLRCGAQLFRHINSKSLDLRLPSASNSASAA